MAPTGLGHTRVSVCVHMYAGVARQHGAAPRTEQEQELCAPFGH